MVITHLKGGLGNQMFQYACGYALAKDFNSIHKLDTSYYTSIPSNHTKRTFELSLFNISSPVLKESDLERILSKKTKLDKYLDDIKSKFYTIFTGFYPIEKYFGVENLYLDGYFQSEKFFVKYRDYILKEFSLNGNQGEAYNRISKKITNEKRSISMHIRRGDYVTDIKASKHHGVLGVEYYKKGLNILNIRNPKIFVFSDDIDWVRKEFTFLPKDTYFVSKHHFNSAQEIILMSLCKHNIIANSSFSWWGAWLNQNNKKNIIAPKRWTQSILAVNTDITPKDWYRI